MRTLIVIVLLVMSAVVCAAAEGSDVFTVVIDPGHGGKDTGCVGKVAKEKDIALNVGLKLKKKIESKYKKKVKVVMTRETDKFITLQGRADIANKSGGDLFISIHVNSVDKKSKNRATVSGASVYACGNHKSTENLRVAMRENSVMELEKNHTTQYHGFDPQSSESYIMFELSQSKHLEQSLRFAQLAKNSLVKKAGRADKGVRQAGFWVLWATAMPSVLVELDFICNPTNEKFLNSVSGQDKCAESLMSAFEEYYNTLGRNS